MRALMLQEATGPGGLEVVEVPDAEPAEGMVLIEVHAAGVGFVDMLISKGEYQIKPPLPFIPGLEVAGVVRSAPDGSGLEQGDRVVATTGFGGWAELALAPANLVAKLPGAVSFEVAAGMLINFLTAHLGLRRRGRLAPGESVLVHGAAGGVGTASIQVAKALGAGLVVAVASSHEKREAALAAGADHALDGEDWVPAVKELTGGGADVVVDPVGGDAFDLSLKCMKPFGRLLVVGFASGRIPQLPVNRLLLRHLDVVGVNYGGVLTFDAGYFAEGTAELLPWIADGTLAPPIAAPLPLEEGHLALTALEQRTQVGKPVLTLR